jgi:hypothetical protein
MKETSVVRRHRRRYSSEERWLVCLTIAIVANTAAILAIVVTNQSAWALGSLLGLAATLVDSICRHRPRS